MSQSITVNVVSSVSTGASSGFFLIPGNFTSLFYPGFPFLLFTGTEELRYVTVSSTFATGNTQVNVASAVFGSVVALGSFTPGTGPFISGTYAPIPTTTNHNGIGAQVQAIVTGPGPINSVGLITGGTGYNNNNYLNVPLTGGTGSGAQATVIVSGGFVTQVFVTAAGTGYVVGDTLSASNTNLGGIGSGFSVPVLTVLGTLTSVTLVTQGLGYQAGDTLTFGGVGYGTGNTVAVATATSGEMGSIILDNNQPMFIVGQDVFVISAGNASCQTPWWSMLPTQTPIPAVQAAQVLAVTVYYSNQNNSPMITYSVRLGNQPGAAMVPANMVYVDLPTAIAAYQTQLASSQF